MKEKIKKVCNWTYFPFLVLFIVLTLCCFFMNVSNCGDDKWFIEVSSDKSSIDYLNWRYEEWTSRIIIEFCLINLLKMGNIVCSIFVALIFSLLGIAISKTFILDKSKKDKVKIINWIIMFLLLTISYDVLTGAGFVSTTVNYMFPVTLGIFVLLYVRKSILKEKIKKYEYPLYLLSAIVATNMEQMCAVLFVVCFLSLIYFIIKEKRLNIFNLILFIISIHVLVNILVCPGNDLRNISETQTWFPDYANYGIIEKAKCGIFVIISSCIGNLNIPYIIFATVVMIEVLKNYKNIFFKIISIIPVIAGTIFTVFAPITANIFPNMFGINNAIISGFNVHITRLLFLAPYILALICLVFSTILIFKKNWKTLILILILGAGFASKFIMGFSPTVFASGTRTSFIMLCAFIISTILVLEKQNKKYFEKFVSVIVICAILQSAENICGLYDIGIL